MEELAQAKEQIVHLKEALAAAAQKEADADAKTKQIEGLMSKSSGTLGLRTTNGNACNNSLVPSLDQVETKRTK